MDRQKIESSAAIIKRSYMWNQRGHVIKKFILGPKFRMHDKNFRNSNIHMYRSLIKEKLVLFEFLMNWKKKRKKREKINRFRNNMNFIEFFLLEISARQLHSLHMQVL